MAKSAKASTVFDVTGIIPSQKENISNNNTQQTQTINNSFNIEKPKKEIKSKRVNLVLHPSLYEKAQALAKSHGVSFNEMITQLLQQITQPMDDCMNKPEVFDGTLRPDGQFKGQISIEEFEK